MRLPPEFLKDLAILIEPLCHNTGVIALSELDVINGKAARVAHVVPQAKPFVAGLWGALSAVQRLGPSSRSEAPPGYAACRRFSYSAAWVRALISQSEDSPLALERLVTPKPPSASPSSGWSAEFDASIYGGGAVLKSPDGTIQEYFQAVWLGNEAEHLNVWIEDSKHQTFWDLPRSCSSSSSGATDSWTAVWRFSETTRAVSRMRSISRAAGPCLQWQESCPGARPSSVGTSPSATCRQSITSSPTP